MSKEKQKAEANKKEDLFLKFKAAYPEAVITFPKAIPGKALVPEDFKPDPRDIFAEAEAERQEIRKAAEAAAQAEIDKIKAETEVQMAKLAEERKVADTKREALEAEVKRLDELLKDNPEVVEEVTEILSDQVYIIEEKNPNESETIQKPDSP